MKELLLGITLLAILGCSATERSTPDAGTPQRIISLAPSITETLFALGLGERVVGVTRFCTFPPEASQRTRLGGYLDPGYEAMVRLQPDLVVLMREHGAVRKFLETRKIPYVAIDNHDVGSILESFRQIGSRCRVGDRADSLVQSIQHELLQEKPADGKSPRVLLCVGRDDVGSGKITRLYAAGQRTFYQELMHAAGARNVLQDSSLVYPQLSAEGVVALQPDIIIDLMATMSTSDTTEVAHDWQCLPMVPAVRHGRLYCLTGNYLTVPGPRIVRILREFRRIVRPTEGHKGDHESED